MAKPKLKKKTREQALSVAEEELSEKAAQKVALEQALMIADTRLTEKESELDKLQATLRVESSKRAAEGAEFRVQIQIAQRRIDSMVWALVLAQDVCRDRETELQRKVDESWRWPAEGER